MSLTGIVIEVRSDAEVVARVFGQILLAHCCVLQCARHHAPASICVRVRERERLRVCLIEGVSERVSECVLSSSVWRVYLFLASQSQHKY